MDIDVVARRTATAILSNAPNIRVSTEAFANWMLNKAMFVNVFQGGLEKVASDL